MMVQISSPKAPPSEINVQSNRCRICFPVCRLLIRQQHGRQNDKLMEMVMEVECSKMQNSFVLAAPTHSAMMLTKLQHMLSTYDINYKNTQRQQSN